MTFLKYSIAFCFIAISSLTAMHKYYLSLTELNFVKDDQSLQMTSELFIDDLEKVLKNRYDDDIALLEDHTSEKSKSYIKLYLKDKISIKINNEKIDFNFLGFEYKDDKIICYQEASNVTEISNFEVSNTLLFDMFSKQKNIVKLKIDDVEKSVLLIKGKEKERIDF